MVKIRLSLKGKKGQRSYWIVAIDSKRPRDSGKFLEYLGWWKKTGKKEEIKLDKENIKKWLSWGAQPTDKAVKRLLEEYL